MMPDLNLSALHFLRPEWFFAIIPLILIVALLLRRKLFSRNWQNIIDTQLMPYVLIGKPGKQSYWPVLAVFITGLLCIVSLAGPVWQRLPQPVYKQQTALVVALNLSHTMNAEDVKPSRLERARFKLRDLLALRKEGQTALVVYAQDAFVVTPLTDDTNTIASLIPSLTTDMMPVQGNNTAAAIQKSVELLKNTGVSSGNILLITDDISDAGTNFIDAAKAGYSVSILGIGTADGAPVAALNGGFLKDNTGAIIISKLNSSRLSEAAQLGKGRYSFLTTDEQDIQYLLSVSDVNRLHSQSKQTELKTDAWREEGPWLLLLVIPLAALAFRKGYLAILLVFLLPIPQPAQAFSWDALWKNNNQRAADKFSTNPQEAAQLFTNPAWQAAAQYRAGNFDQSAQTLNGINNSDAHYNRGNALARAGKIDDAISAYDEALKLNPNNEDARFNKQLLEKQKQQNKNGQQQSQSGQKQDQQGNNSQQDNKQGDQSGSNQQQSDKHSQQEKHNESQQGSVGAQKQYNNADQKQNNTQPDSKNNSTQNQQQDLGKSGSDNEKQQPAMGSDDKPDLNRQANEQWLRKIPDDPGGLLRRKFKYQYQQQSGN